MAYLGPDSPIPTKGKGSKLGSKQRLFVSEYLVDLNATAACVRAGYKTNNPTRLGTELLRHPLIKAGVEAGLTKRMEINEIKADYLINKLVSIIEATESDNPQACLRAIELAGKSIALWKERQEISGPDGDAIRMEQKVKQDVADFTSSLTRLAKRAGEGTVVEFSGRKTEAGA